MINALLHLRWVSLIAVISSVVGSFLMFFIGAIDTHKAIEIYFGIRKSQVHAGEKLLGVDAMVHLVTALDSFLFALVLFYFAFGIYSLFIKLGRGVEEDQGAFDKLPKWLRVNSLGQLKKTLIEVIIVLIAILFLKDALYLQTDVELQWKVLITPMATVAFAIVLKLVKFDEH